MNERLERLMKASKTMGCSEAGHVLGLSRSAVQRAVNGERIGAEQVHLRSMEGNRKRPSFTLSRGAVLRFIVRTTTGDEREELLRDIELHYPTWLEMAKRAAAQKEDPPASLREALRVGESQESPPKNVIPFKRGQRRHADPAPGHPDLFATA